MKRIIIAVVLVLLGSVAWCTRVYLIRRTTSTANACVSGNLRQIDATKEMWAKETRTTNGPVDVDACCEYIKGGMPVCPAGGTYTFGDIGEDPSCSIHGTYNNRRYPKWWNREELEQNAAHIFQKPRTASEHGEHRVR